MRLLFSHPSLTSYISWVRHREFMRADQALEAIRTLASSRSPATDNRNREQHDLLHLSSSLPPLHCPRLAWPTADPSCTTHALQILACQCPNEVVFGAAEEVDAEEGVMSPANEVADAAVEEGTLEEGRLSTRAARNDQRRRISWTCPSIWTKRLP